jgi:hypothetical protein
MKPKGQSREQDCPHCGASFRAGRLACPECGSDARTGWQEAEEIDYQALDLEVPGYGEEARPDPRARRTRWIAFLVVAAMIGALVFAIARR